MPADTVTARPRTVRCASRHIPCPWGLGGERHEPLRVDVCLATAELVANACEVTPDHPIRIRFSPEFERRLLLLAVWDVSDDQPKVITPDLTLETLDLSEENFDKNGGWVYPLSMPLRRSTAQNRHSRTENGYG